MSDSIENVLVELMRANNTHIDKSNKSQLVTNDLVKSLVEKFGKLMTQNEKLNEKVEYLTGKVDIMRREQDESTKEILDLHNKLDNVSESLVEYDKNNKEIVNSLPKPKVKKSVIVETRIYCKCLTKKGIQCKKYCIEGHDTCKQHANMANTKPNIVTTGDISTDTNVEKPTKPVTVRKRKSAKKEKVKPPMHNHDPGEKPTTPCDLCLSHGDIFDQEMLEDEFVCISDKELSLEERLQIAIDNENTEPHDPGDSGDTGVGANNWADMVDEDNNA
tara:strand:- start:236 stop:1060 length:825 start_codon:yes stop_codon:yes gene_type:complete